MADDAATIATTRSRLARSFTRKKVVITLTVAKGGQGPQPYMTDTVTLEGYRCQVEVTNAGLFTGQTCNARIYGLALPIINRLSLLSYPVEPSCLDAIRTTYNTMRVQAGDDETGLSTIYYGIISEAFADFKSAPEPAFQVYSHSVQGPNAAIVPARTYMAGSSLAGVMSGIASEAGYTFVNYGLNVRLKEDTYLHGTLSDQIDQLHKAFRFIYRITNGDPIPDQFPPLPRYQITVWSRNLADIAATMLPKVSSRTGMVGYPSYNSTGITLTTLFDPRLQFMAPFQVDSQYLPEAWVSNQSGQIAPMPVNGSWLPYLIQHELDCDIPGGRWFTNVEAIRADNFGTIGGVS